MTDTQIAAYYASLLSKYGPTYRAGDYGSEESQKARLGALAESILTGDEGNSVLDVGCGVGDLLTYIPKTMTYLGWDFSPVIVDAASRQWPDRSFATQSLMTSTETGLADYVLASGLFQFRGLTWLKGALTRMFALAKTCVAFNVLTRTSITNEIAQDPFTVGRFCRTLTPRVHIRTDYLPNDATIVMWKD